MKSIKLIPYFIFIYSSLLGVTLHLKLPNDETLVLENIDPKQTIESLKVKIKEQKKGLTVSGQSIWINNPQPPDTNLNDEKTIEDYHLNENSNLYVNHSAEPGNCIIVTLAPGKTISVVVDGTETVEETIKRVNRAIKYDLPPGESYPPITDLFTQTGPASKTTQLWRITGHDGGFQFSVQKSLSSTPSEPANKSNKPLGTGSSEFSSQEFQPEPQSFPTIPLVVAASVISTLLYTATKTERFQKWWYPTLTDDLLEKEALKLYELAKEPLSVINIKKEFDILNKYSKKDADRIKLRSEELKEINSLSQTIS